MEKIKLKEVIAVEGRYDAHAVRACFDTEIIELGGFGIFKNRTLLEMLKKYAQTRGLVLLTDSDSAGFMIRARVAKSVPAGSVRHAYVPDVQGKESRKKTPSAENLLGVEGMSREVIISAVLASGATVEGQEHPSVKKEEVTRLMLYEDGFFGGKNSAALRLRLTLRLGLPARISVSGLLGAINTLSSCGEYQKIAAEIKEEYEREKE
ncbi:MAG: DUF4093 domain-containing protein [Clostridia bacterium]|nr:DUF4093 domain-containing protein [Clostridia bacterium]